MIFLRRRAVWQYNRKPFFSYLYYAIEDAEDENDDKGYLEEICREIRLAKRSRLPPSPSIPCQMSASALLINPHRLHPSVHWAFALAMCADCRGPGREGTPYNCTEGFQGGSSGETYVDKPDPTIEKKWPWKSFYQFVDLLKVVLVFGDMRPLLKST